MLKDFSGAGRQEKSCTLIRLNSLTEYESLESRLEHCQRATIYNVTVPRVPDGRCSAAEGAVDEMSPGMIGFCSNWSDKERRCRVASLSLM